MRRNIEIFEALGLLAGNVKTALVATDEALAAAGPAAAQERLSRERCPTMPRNI